MGLNLATAKYDQRLEDEGRWIDLSLGGRVRVARWDNPKARAAGAAYDMKTRRELQRLQRSQDAESLLEWSDHRDVHVIVEGVLLEWEEFIDEAGSAFPYSKKNARVLLGQEHYRWIAREIRDAAQEEQAYRQQEEEEDLGNSETASPGSTSGASAQNGSDT